ncbi:hypothetical protein BN1012_Phect2622 [Candidatus Phaeomarinobacter ectocarpi]|uniref:Sulfate transporter n=1 Tax=Candidatus Phaeomarinibacter ectocarpi TaxID=1458461 RepID=X5MMZ4_9HYPH|nr:DUF3164 family protein [Candidatus Phaeomarinobacter ectocarpi]CDO60835.1 hypothetical protein BN1012_Phect2622 [Candidatus Phaeomarinobacter ectocarpi]
MTQKQIPDGYMQDSTGKLVPESLVKPIDKERDALVLAVVEEAADLNRAIAAFKSQIFDEIQAFLDLSAERYDVKLGGRKGNVQLTSFDGKYRVLRAISELITFDEGLQAAKALIDECIAEWSGGADDKIKVLVNDAFQVNKGRIDTQRVLGLRKLEIDDPKWKRAMEAISDAVTVHGTRSYIRIYERIGETDKYRQISLDMAGA